MSKFKSKKLSKSSIAIILLSFALISLLAFGATFALFTASSNVHTSNGITAGHIKLTSNSSLSTARTNVLPSESLLSGDVTVTPDTADAENGGQYIAMKVTVAGTKGASAASGAGTPFAAGELATLLSITPSAGWVSAGANTNYVFVYCTTNNATTSTAATAATGSSAITAFSSSSGILMSSAVEDSYDEGTSTTTNGYMDATFTITIQFKSVQVTGNTATTVAAVGSLLFSDCFSAQP